MNKERKSFFCKILPGISALALLLGGCSQLPALPFLPQTGKLTCPQLVVGILIGEDDDPIAAEQRDGYEMALQEVNADPGLKGCQVQLSYRSETQENDASQVQQTVRALVETDQAIAVLGGSSDPASMHAASLVNYFKVPMILPAAAGTHVLPADNHWAFNLSPSESTYAQTIAAMLKEQLGEGKRVTVFYEDSTFGNDAAVAAVTALEAESLNIDGYFAYDAGQTDISKIVDQVKNIQPDALYLIFDQPEQASAILSAFKDAQVAAPLTVARAGGFLGRSFLWKDAKTTNPLAENLIIATPWIDKSDPSTGTGFGQGFESFTSSSEGAAYAPTVYSAEAYESLKILASTLAAELSSDATFSSQNLQKQRETLRGLLQAYQKNDPSWGNIAFDSGGQNQASIYLVQVFNGQLVTVYPANVAERAPVISLSSGSK